MLVENQLVADLFVKANQQCVTVDNASSIPPNMFATQKNCLLLNSVQMILSR